MASDQEARLLAQRRIANVLGHLHSSPGETSSSSLNQTSSSAVPPQGSEATDSASQPSYAISKPKLKWNGWGYAGTEFDINDEGHIYLAGGRYQVDSHFPNFRPWMEMTVDGVDLDETSDMRDTIICPPMVRNEPFIQATNGRFGVVSFDEKDRVSHAHGQTLEEIFTLRNGEFPRVPDCVIWPERHEDVENLVQIACKHNVCLIPYGGGTTVSKAVKCPDDEKRMIVSVDMRKMTRIKWVDRESLLACVEAGIVGIELEERLGAMGLTVGHEPDSHEFSTLGGWVATRASGMKKNAYGNIEDILVHCRAVTPIGTLEKNCYGPRISTGPDVYNNLLGSEGILGIVTEVTMKVRPLPQVRSYGSIAFPNFETGVQFMRDLAHANCYPASARLVDNTQFKFGHALSAPVVSRIKQLKDQLKRLYITKWHHFDLDQMAAVTLVFEGDSAIVAQQQSIVYSLAAKHGGVKAGEENGKRGYFLTWMIAYLRDFGLKHEAVSESFETSVPWANVTDLCNNVKAKVEQLGEEKGLPYKLWVSCRVSQIYHTGACVYFYLGFVYRGVDDPVAVFEDIESDARDEIIRNGGSLSHHHGVGKLRKKWFQDAISPVGVEMVKGIKKTVDPQNIFCAGNLVDL